MSSFNYSRDRYALLIRPGVDADGKKAPSQDYAAFLRDKERMCGPEGFVDSEQVQHQYTVKKQTREQKGGQQSSERHKPGKEATAQQDINSAGQNADSSTKNKPYTVLDLSARKEKDDKDFNRRLKLIEEHMWQHKQDERELKRAEGDIVKNQRNLRRLLRDKENSITRNKLEEEKRLQQSLNKYSQIEQDHVHEKKKASRQRAEEEVSSAQMQKDLGRKNQVTVCRLSREYQSKMSELQLRQKEANRISQDFESRLRQKEEEQFRLKSELAELAIALNMEAQKGRQQEYSYQREKKKETSQKVQQERERQSKLDSELGNGDCDVKAAENNRRKMSTDLALTKAHLSLKQREEGRKRQDTENRLRANAEEQRQLNEAALHAELELKAKQADQKVQEHNARRKAQMDRTLQQRKAKSESQENHFSQKAERRSLEIQRLEHEDHLKHSQKMVSLGEQQEYTLYNQVKNCEYRRQKKEQTVRQLQSKIQEIKRQHAAKMQKELTECARQERDLELKLKREQAELSKAHAEREENYYTLQKHREQLKSDRYLLAEREREHDRLMRISEKTESTVHG